MLRPLSTIRRRVDRLATQAASARCAGNHQRTRIVTVYNDDPTPPWPEADAGGLCARGTPLEFTLIVNKLRV